MKAMTAAETRQRLRADRERLLATLHNAGEKSPLLWLHPSWQAVWLHRWSHHHFVNGHRLLARFLWHLNLMLNGADISPQADVGPGMLIVSPATLILLGRFGHNLTIMPHVGVGGGISSDDIGGGPGLPVFGDNVTLGFASVILGAIKVGNDVMIGPRCLVTRDIPDGMEVNVTEPKLIRASLPEVANG